ncbi:MAG: PQQ-binding-like beta-propeller repeat protein [Pirellulaceae bacterium]|nr:PQQ-binding-like beta-propeller repeat protein [Pirellulaceae bacterium]
MAAAKEKEGGIADFPMLNAESDWPWWRGPSRSGHAHESAEPPTSWSENKNVVWKVPLPGRGHSSPIIAAGRILLTTADEAKQQQWVLALNHKTGNQLWTKVISQGGLPKLHVKNTHATPSIASDGERLFVVFCHHETVQVSALTLGGQDVWQKTVSPFRPRRYEYGYAPSPLIYRDTVIIAAEYDGDSSLVAFDRETGKEIWRTPRPGNISYSSPVVAHLAGRDQLLLSGADQVCSYDPNSGKLLWSTPGTAAATCGTIVWDGDIVFASGGYPKSETLAIKADGSGEVLWRNGKKCYEQSMLATGGHLYALTGNGIVYCWRGSDGEEMWNERLRGPVSASPVLAGGNIYWGDEAGMVYVFRANPEEFELVSRNQLLEDSFASPAVSGNQLFLRVAKRGGQREEFLFCLGSK